MTRGQGLEGRGAAGTIGVSAILLLAAGCNSVYPPLEVVHYVDLERYTGRWFEIARYPHSFERDCAGVTADYSLRDDGRIEVINTCFESSLDGPERLIRGSARVADPTTNAKLKVTFFWPFEGDYWIIDLDNEYEYAVVGAPNRRFLWILSRTPTMDGETYEAILDRLAAQDYDTQPLELVPQRDPSS